MTAADHNAEFEELMVWLDGELAGPEADRVRAHVATCAECQQMEAEMRSVSGKLAGWVVDEAPASVVRPQSRWSAGSVLRWLPAAAGIIIAAGLGLTWLVSSGVDRRDRGASAIHPSAPPEPAAEPQASGGEATLTGQQKLNEIQAPAARDSIAALQGRVALSELGEQVPGAPLLVRTARLTLIPADFDVARAEMEGIVAAAGGFTGRIVIGGGLGTARSLSATLRVPTSALDETLSALRKLGQVTGEGQDGEDVTQQSADLDARLANSRAAESRLKDIMEKRTGKLSEVLDVEREIARVRGEIEQMEAQRKSLDRRIIYAVITLQISEERKAAVDLGPQSVGTRLRNALVDGSTGAISSLLELTLLVARIAPVLTLWIVLLAGPAWMLRRRFAK